MTSRRMFLRAATGATLAIPFLPSLQSKGHAQVSNAPIFVGVSSLQGTFRRNWEVDMSGETQIAPRAWRKDATAVAGPLSPTLGHRFDSLRDKLTVFQGLDGLSIFEHSYCFPFAGANHTPGEGGRLEPPVTAVTMDAVLETRSVVLRRRAPPRFRAAPWRPRRAAMPFTAFPGGTTPAVPVSYPYERSAQAALQAVFQVDAPPSADPRRLRVMDQVIDDYRRVRTNARLSNEDRQRLDQYADLVQGVSARLEATQALECNTPGLRDEAGQPMSTVYSNHIDLMVAALACGATRVGRLHIEHFDEADSSGSIFHGWSHGLDRGGLPGTSLSDEENMRVANNWIADRVSELVTKMDAVTMPDGSTLLDRAAVMWSNELGGAEHHNQFGMPVLVAGSAGGRLRTNAIYDYRARPRVHWFGRDDFPPMGRPYNALLIAIMQAMGLAPNEYERSPGAGFGDYDRIDHDGTRGAYADYLGRNAEALPDYFL